LIAVGACIGGVLGGFLWKYMFEQHKRKQLREFLQASENREAFGSNYAGLSHVGDRK